MCSAHAAKPRADDARPYNGEYQNDEQSVHPISPVVNDHATDKRRLLSYRRVNHSAPVACISPCEEKERWRGASEAGTNDHDGKQHHHG
jgi:hypothetical protein